MPSRACKKCYGTFASHSAGFDEKLTYKGEELGTTIIPISYTFSTFMVFGANFLASHFTFLDFIDIFPRTAQQLLL